MMKDEEKKEAKQEHKKTDNSARRSDTDDMEVINDPSFYDGFDISHDPYFAQRNDPVFTFNDGQIGVNSCCVRKLSEVEYVQILVNREKKMLVVRPCDEYDVYPLRWCNEKNGKRYPRHVVSRILHLKICDLMKWNPVDRYKIFGAFKIANGEKIIVFNLQSIQMYPRLIGPDGKKKTSRIGLMQESWKDSFGIPFNDKEKAYQINMFEGCTMISLVNNEEQSANRNESPVQTNTSLEKGSTEVTRYE